jgi:hypothetical protein
VERLIGAGVEVLKVSRNCQVLNGSVGEDSPSDQKWPPSVVAKPGLRRFQTSPAHETGVPLNDPPRTYSRPTMPSS